MMYPVDFYPHKSNKNAKFNVRKSKWINWKNI
jgi:hypothetical protein